MLYVSKELPTINCHSCEEYVTRTEKIRMEQSFNIQYPPHSYCRNIYYLELKMFIQSSEAGVAYKAQVFMFVFGANIFE